MIQFKINGQQAEVELDSAMPILWVLRDELKLTGTKFGCGKGLCGACTVHLDGVAVRSCSTPLSEAAGKSITTIEGLGAEGALHPVQAAWIEHNVPQCGYCQCGQIMTAAAFLKHATSPSETEIDAAMSGNLCRCGTYPRIRKAMQQLAARDTK